MKSYTDLHRGREQSEDKDLRSARGVSTELSSFLGDVQRLTLRLISLDEENNPRVSVQSDLSKENFLTGHMTGIPTTSKT